ncbi:MAG: TetR/AcrR family transcriptional regulator [Desulfomonilaceae bacterium]
MSEHGNKRDEIIQAALSFFASRGFRGTSIRDIAGACNTSLSNIYHYFGDKEGVVLAILQTISEELVTSLRIAAQKDLDPLGRFKWLVVTHCCVGWERSREGKILILEEEHLSAEGRKVSRQIQKEILEIYRSVLRPLQELDLLRGKSLTITALNVLALVNWFFRWYRRDGPMSLEEASEEIVSFAVHGALVGDDGFAAPAKVKSTGKSGN